MNERIKIRDCICERDNICLYIAWKFDHITRITDILAICRTEELARKYAANYRPKETLTVSTWVDTVCSDHLLGSTMYGKRQ
jgi:hypothetical protein